MYHYKDFSSNTSQELKGLLNEWISYYQNENMEGFHSTGERIERLAVELRKGEKQNVNTWLQSKDSITLIK